jgi:hypothetical protein
LSGEEDRTGSGDYDTSGGDEGHGLPGERNRTGHYRLPKDDAYALSGERHRSRSDGLYLYERYRLTREGHSTRSGDGDRDGPGERDCLSGERDRASTYRQDLCERDGLSGECYRTHRRDVHLSDDSNRLAGKGYRTCRHALRLDERYRLAG